MNTQIACAKFVNNVYEPMRAYIKAHRGWNMDDLITTPLCADYTKAMHELMQFDGMKVKVKYSTSQEWHSGSGEMIGKIKVDKEANKVKFYEGRKTAHFRYLDLGMFDGWHATIVCKEMEAV